MVNAKSDILLVFIDINVPMYKMCQRSFNFSISSLY